MLDLACSKREDLITVEDVAQWLTVDAQTVAASEQEPELAPGADVCLRRHGREAAAGALALTADYADLLVLP